MDSTRAVTLKKTENDGSGLSLSNTGNFGETIADQDETDDICLDLSQLIPHKIHLYTLRSSKESSKFTIQAIFSSDVKINFERDTALNTENDVCPYVHHLTLDLMLNNNGHFYVTYKGLLHTINEYYLRISMRSYRGNKHFINEKRRFLSDCLRASHQLLFNTDFCDHISTNAPGKRCMI